MNLGQAAKEQVYLIECTACKHKAQVDLIAMCEKLGESFPMNNLKTKLRCSRCRSKKTILTTAMEIVDGNTGVFAAVSWGLIHALNPWRYRYTFVRCVMRHSGLSKSR